MNCVRVLHICGSMSCGGVGAFLMAYYRHVNRDRLQFDFVVHYEEKQYYEDEITQLGGRVYHVASKSRHLLRNIRQMQGILAGTPENAIVHIHTSSASSSLNAVLARLAGKSAFVAHSHSTALESESSLLHLVLRPLLVATATDLFACSMEAGRWLYGDKTCANGSVRVINNAIDAQRFRYIPASRARIRTELGLDGRFVVGHVGRFADVKNHAFLIGTFREVCQAKPNSILMLIGDGPLRGDIEGKVEQLGLTSDVRFLGARDDVGNLLQAMDVFVMPSLFEGFPVSLVESQASGLPSVASDSITSEVVFTDLVDLLPLSRGPAYWADRIMAHAGECRRRDTSAEVVKAGYDIAENAKWLEDFYLSKVR